MYLPVCNLFYYVDTNKAVTLRMQLRMETVSAHLQFIDLYMRKNIWIDISHIVLWFSTTVLFSQFNFWPFIFTVHLLLKQSRLNDNGS